MTTSTIAMCDHGTVTKTKRVIMERDVYDKKWKLGPFSMKKQQLKSEGKLDQYGRITQQTPEVWKLLFGGDENGVKLDDVASQVKSSSKKTSSTPAATKGKEAEPEKKDKKKKQSKKEKDSEEEEEEEDPTPKKAKKDKKDKKDKKIKKKSKKADSDDDEEEEEDVD